MGERESMPVPVAVTPESGHQYKYKVLVDGIDGPVERGIEVDDSAQACAPLGVLPGQIIQDYPGGAATVAGVYNGVH